MLKKLLFIFLVLSSNHLLAAIYEYKGDNGQIYYSDTPNENAKEINPGNMNSITTPIGAPTANSPSVAVPASSDVVYDSLSIISPKEQETIQNQPTVDITVDVKPALVGNDKFQLFIDGSPAGSATNNTSFSVGLTERGTHTLYVAIINGDQKVLKTSKTITIFVHRNTINTSPASQTN